MKLFALIRPPGLVFAGLLAVGILVSHSSAQANAEDSTGITFGGAGWMQDNFIGHSSANTAFDGKSVLSIGTQVSVNDKVSDRLKIAVELGIFTGNPLINPGTQPGYSLPSANPYVSEANFTYAFIKGEQGKDKGNSSLWLRGGLFPYSYNPDAKDLGQYLLRGPVHPGLLVSGYETLGYLTVADMTSLPVANLTGLQLHGEWNHLQADLLLSSETEYYPYFDVSPALVIQYQVHPAFRIGAGVNVYHLIPVDYGLTNRNYDPGDSSTDISYAGTKVMATAAFDPKPLLRSGPPFGPEDLRLYGEIAVIGLENSAAYRRLYGDYLQRMPVMVGFNLPVFSILDHLSLEVEWYGADFADDMSGYNKDNYTPLPYGANLSGEYGRDNWKWSVHTSKTLQKHVMLTLQVADDHYRPGIYQGIGDSAPPLRYAVLITPKDWYLSTKVSYSF